MTTEQVKVELEQVGIILSEQDGFKDNHDGTWSLLLSVSNLSFDKFWEQFSKTPFEQVSYMNTWTQRFMQFRVKT